VLPLRDVSYELCRQPEALKFHWSEPWTAVMPDAGAEVAGRQLDLPRWSTRLVPGQARARWVVAVYRLQACAHSPIVVPRRGTTRPRQPASCAGRSTS